MAVPGDPGVERDRAEPDVVVVLPKVGGHDGVVDVGVDHRAVALVHATKFDEPISYWNLGSVQRP